MAATVKCPLRHPNTAFRSIGDDGGLVVLPGRSEVKVLNPVAIKVFGLLDGRHTLEEIAGEVVGEFEIDERQAIEDIRSFVEELSKHGMLVSDDDKVPGGSGA